MKYVGISFFIFGALAFAGVYISYLKRRVEEYVAFSSLVAYMRIQIGCFMRTPRELIGEFESETLRDTGFLEALEECSDMGEAYARIQGKLLLKKRESELVQALFSSLGEVYYEEGVRLLNSAQEELERACEREREASAKNKRLVSALSATVALAVIMLVI